MKNTGNRYDIVSSMSAEYYHNWGAYMIQTFLGNWHPNFTMTLYSEDLLPIDHPRIKVVSLDMFGKDLRRFCKEQHTNDRASIFAKKAWPIMHHLNPNNGYLIWIDADVMTESFMYPKYITTLVGDKFSAHLGVPQGDYYSVETGFFVINRAYKLKNLFLKKYKDIYQNRDFTNMYKPFDGDTFGRVITECIEYGLEYNELSPKPDKVRSPFNKVFQGKMWHLKGKHKDKHPNDSPRLQRQLDKFSKMSPSLSST